VLKMSRRACVLFAVSLPGDWAGSRSSAEEARAVDPNSTKALYRCGVAYCHLGMYEESKAELRRAVELDPKDKCVDGRTNSEFRLVRS
jgi:tetratricopeptide (TPR) repeat protein